MERSKESLRIRVGIRVSQLIHIEMIATGSGQEVNVVAQLARIVAVAFDGCQAAINRGIGRGRVERVHNIRKVGPKASGKSRIAGHLLRR